MRLATGLDVNRPVDSRLWWKILRLCQDQDQDQDQRGQGADRAQDSEHEKEHKQMPVGTATATATATAMATFVPPSLCAVDRSLPPAQAFDRNYEQQASDHETHQLEQEYDNGLDRMRDGTYHLHTAARRSTAPA